MVVPTHTFFLPHDCDSCGESSVAVATSRFIVVQDMLTAASVRHIPVGMATVTCLDASQSGHHLVAGTNTSDLLLWWVHYSLLLHACCHPPLHISVSPTRSLSLSVTCGVRSPSSCLWDPSPATHLHPCLCAPPSAVAVCTLPPCCCPGSSLAAGLPSVACPTLATFDGALPRTVAMHRSACTPTTSQSPTNTRHGTGVALALASHHSTHSLVLFALACNQGSRWQCAPRSGHGRPALPSLGAVV